MQEYLICANKYLKTNTKAYFSLYYVDKYNEDTKFILTLKNEFDWEKPYVLKKAKAKAEEILQRDLFDLINRENLNFCTVVAVPRSKDYKTYLPQQLCLIEAISNAAQSLKNVNDGTDYIQRCKNTMTTHLPRNTGRMTAQGNIPRSENANDGDVPYPGITHDTCIIKADKIKGQTIILVDDIYTQSRNIDEDCIQALYDAGAKKVIFYSLAITI